MADSVNVSSASSGPTIPVAVQTVAGIAYQVIKLAQGASGTTGMIDATTTAQPAAGSMGLVVAILPGASVTALVSGAVSVSAIATGTVSVSGTLVVSGTISVSNVISVTGALISVLSTGTVSISGVVLASITVSATVGTIIAVSGITAVSAVSTIVTVLGTINVAVAGVTTTQSSLTTGVPVWLAPTQTMTVAVSGAVPAVTTQSNVTAAAVWLAPTQTLSLVSTIVTILGTQVVTIAQTSVVALVSVTASATVGTIIAVSGVTAVSNVSTVVTLLGTVLVSITPGSTTGSSGMSGVIVWLGASQTINISIPVSQTVGTIIAVSGVTAVSNVSTVVTVLGTVLVSVAVSATVGTIIAVSGVTAVSNVSTVVTLLGTVNVNIAAAGTTIPVNIVAGAGGGGSVTTAVPSVSASGQIMWVAGGQSTSAFPVFVSQINPPGGGGLQGGYLMAVATTSNLSSSTQVMLMTVYNSTGVTAAISGWTIAAGSALVVYGLGFGVSYASTLQATFMLAVTTSNATLSTVVTAWAQVTLSTVGAASQFISTGWTPGGVIGINSSITQLQFPFVIPGPAVVGLVVAMTTSGATVYGSILASVVATMPIVQPVTGTVAIGAINVISTIVTILGTQVVSVVPGLSVLASITASAIVGTVIAVSGITAVSNVSTIVTLLGTVLVNIAASATVGTIIAVSGVTAVSNVSTVITLLGTVLVSVAVSAIVGTVIAVSGVTAVSNVSTVVTLLGTVLVSVVASAIVGTIIAVSGVTAVSNVSTIITLLGTVLVSQVPGASVTVLTPLIGGYWWAIATTTAMSSSSQTLLMSVYNSTGSTNAIGGWTIGAGSALMVYGLNFGWSQAAANMQVTFMLAVTNSNATLSTVATAWAQVTFTTAAALSTIISTGWVPGGVVGSNTSVTAINFPLVIPGPAVVGLMVAATSSGATVYGSILGSIVGTMPIVQPVAISGAIAAVTTQLATTGAPVWLAPTQSMTVTIASALVSTTTPASGVTGVMVWPATPPYTPFLLMVTSTAGLSAGSMYVFTVWTGLAGAAAATSAYPVPAGKNLRLLNMQAGQAGSAAVLGTIQFMVVAATATASMVSGSILTVGHPLVLQMQLSTVVPSYASIIGFMADVGAGSTIGIWVTMGTSCTIPNIIVQGYLF